MFSLALKNAILLVLIILILHVLLKNMLVERQKPKAKIWQEEQYVELPTIVNNQDDENELYKFVFGEKEKEKEKAAVLDVQPIGNFSKFCDYASV